MAARSKTVLAVAALALVCGPVVISATDTASAIASAQAQGGSALALASAQASAQQASAQSSDQAFAQAHASDLFNKKQFCLLYQWACKSFCHQACCHIPIGLPLTAYLSGKQQCFCTDRDALKSGKNTQFCCNGEGPVHDPIFTDFQNRTFEFFGEPGPTYNVLTHKSAVVNMRLAYAGERHIRHQPGKGTFADVLAFDTADTRVLVEVTEPGSMAVTIDDEEQDLDRQFTVAKPGINVTFHPFYPDVGERVEISTGLFTFTISAVKAFEDETSGYNRGHLDLHTEVKSPPGHLDGVLGTSLYVRLEDRLRDPAERKFHDHGRETEYVVPGLFDGMPLTKQTSRRRRLIEASVIDAIEFPISASLSAGHLEQ